MHNYSRPVAEENKVTEASQGATVFTARDRLKLGAGLLLAAGGVAVVNWANEENERRKLEEEKQERDQQLAFENNARTKAKEHVRTQAAKIEERIDSGDSSARAKRDLMQQKFVAGEYSEADCLASDLLQMPDATPDQQGDALATRARIYALEGNREAAAALFEESNKLFPDPSTELLARICRDGCAFLERQELDLLQYPAKAVERQIRALRDPGMAEMKPGMLYNLALHERNKEVLIALGVPMPK